MTFLSTHNNKFSDKSNSDIQVTDIVSQSGSNHLFAAFGKFIQVKKAHVANSLFSIFVRTLADPKSSRNQDNCRNNNSCNGNLHNAALFSHFHIVIPR